MVVRQVVGESGLAKALSENASKLVVVDFYAEWCGPCKMFAPQYEAMSGEFSDVVFLKVCEKDSMDAMQARGIRAFPTFQLYIKGSKVDEMKGANGDALRAAIVKHRATVPAPAFSGTGMAVGGSGGAAAQGPDAIREARLRAMGAAAAAGGSSSSSASSAPKPSSSSSSSSSAVVLDKSSLATLRDMRDMGFGEVRAAKALLAVGGKSVEAAMEWLADRQDDMDIDEPTEAVTAALRQAAAFKQPTPTAAAAGGGAGSSSAAGGDVAMAGGEGAAAAPAPAPSNGAMTAEEVAEAQAAADAEDAAAAADAGGAAAPPRKLTLEETQARVKALREAKAAKAKEDERLREIARRQQGQKSAETAEALKAQARQFEIDKIKREKEAAEKEKLRLQIEVLKDKAERESRVNGKVSEETLAKLKALQEGKPMPGAGDPKDVIKKAVAGMSMQKREAVGRIAAETLVKLVGNAASSPGEDKFRELKYSMKVVKERLLVSPPSLTVLSTVGFVKEEGPDGPVLRMSKEHAESEAGQGLMREALQQLNAALAAKAFD